MGIVCLDAQKFAAEQAIEGLLIAVRQLGAQRTDGLSEWHRLAVRLRCAGLREDVVPRPLARERVGRLSRSLRHFSLI